VWILTCGLLLPAAAFAQRGTPADAPPPRTTPRGPYAVTVESYPTLATHTAYHPTDLGAFGGSKLLPIVSWGNGACVRNGSAFAEFLTQIASHGYLAIAIGAKNPPAGTGTALPPTEARPIDDHMLLDAVDWATKQNADRSSPFYKKIDVSKVAVMGQSCGGLQAIAVSPDPRVTTSVIMNSGVLPATGPVRGATLSNATKDTLTRLPCADRLCHRRSDRYRLPERRRRLRANHGGAGVQGQPQCRARRDLSPARRRLVWRGGGAVAGLAAERQRRRGAVVHGQRLPSLHGAGLERAEEGHEVAMVRSRCLALVYGLLAIASQAAAQTREEIRLWPGRAPGTEAWTIAETTTRSPAGDRIIANVSDPTVTVFLPDAAAATGAAVVVAPGGALRILGWDNEGIRAAEWLNAKGIAAFVLKYRTLQTPPAQAARRRWRPAGRRSWGRRTTAGDDDSERQRESRAQRPAAGRSAAHGHCGCAAGVAAGPPQRLDVAHRSRTGRHHGILGWRRRRGRHRAGREDRRVARLSRVALWPVADGRERAARYAAALHRRGRDALQRHQRVPGALRRVEGRRPAGGDPCLRHGERWLRHEPSRAAGGQLDRPPPRVAAGAEDRAGR
jgi:hypothetical protein